MTISKSPVVGGITSSRYFGVVTVVSPVSAVILPFVPALSSQMAIKKLVVWCADSTDWLTIPLLRLVQCKRAVRSRRSEGPNTHQRVTEDRKAGEKENSKMGSFARALEMDCRNHYLIRMNIDFHASENERETE